MNTDSHRCPQKFDPCLSVLISVHLWFFLGCTNVVWFDLDYDLSGRAMPKRTFVVFVVSFACLIISSIALADELKLKNGDRITGSIFKADSKTLTLKTNYAGIITVSTDAIAEVISKEPLFVALSNGKTLVGKIATSGGKYEVETKEAEKVAGETSTVQAIRSQADEVFIGEDLALKLSDRVLLKERFQLFPNVTETGEYRHTFDSSLTTKLTSWMTWNVTASNRYISNPPAGSKNNDLLLTTGIGVSFTNFNFKK